ncbi:glycoside hydrolase [Dichotomocladium elegans]|nr:glycoside hydrolase [Dichotomocladium elegans]
MIIMGLEEDYQNALHFIKNDLSFKSTEDVDKGFETSIRYLGGLMSAYDLRPDPILLEKAKEVMDYALWPLFSSPSGAPFTYMDVKSGSPTLTNVINLAEFGTYSLEFTRYSQLIGDETYANAANKLIFHAIRQPSAMPGLYPNDWDINTLKPINDSIVNVGAGGDSFYEYLAKNYLYLGDPTLMEAWTNAVQSIQKYLLSPTEQDPSIQYVATITNGTVGYTSDELICFWPGNILLGISQIADPDLKDELRDFADVFLKSCLSVWEGTATGIAPEVWSWVPGRGATDGDLGGVLPKLKDLFSTKSLLGSSVKRDDLPGEHPDRPFTILAPSYNLRPETIESIFYYYRVTGDPTYQEIAWRMYEAIENYTKTASGYTSINNVDTTEDSRSNFQESFFFAETLKYLYLTFVDPKCISLNEYVFSTEAHPFKLSKSIDLQA